MSQVEVTTLVKSFLKDRSKSSTMKSAFAQAYKEDVLSKKKQFCVEDETDDQNDLRKGLNWIYERVSSGVKLVNIFPSNAFRSSLPQYMEELKLRHPIKSVFVGSMYWFEKDELDQWILTIKESLGLTLVVLTEKPGSTSDFFPELITNYELLNPQNIY